MMHAVGQVQLGKNGVTENFISTLKSHFENHRNVKVSVLRNLTRDKKEIQKISEKIIEELGDHYTAKIIGFTINIKRWRRARVEMENNSEQ
ncbi:YhbY family RNA-binding protein [Candidatus Pacearchaeota archaeon]|nr:YhbY family RNA-binding protein [Candidatus Pacearchaeota archaeon]